MLLILGKQSREGCRSVNGGRQCGQCYNAGDGFRTRHDATKLLLRAGVPIVCEVFNLFSDCIPQEGLNRMESGRRRQVLVPVQEMGSELWSGERRV